jgi:Tfp pilus assembly protein PilN
MTDINLLPWRLNQRARHKKIRMMGFFGLLFSTIFILGLMICYAKAGVHQQRQRNERLQHEILLLTQEDTIQSKLIALRQTLIGQMKVLHDLQMSRAMTMLFFRDWLDFIPNGVVIDKLQRLANTVTITGTAPSPNHIALLMHNIAQLTWIKDASLPEVRQQKELEIERRLGFTLAFTADYRDRI